MQYQVFDTAVGPMGVVVRDKDGQARLSAVRIGHPTVGAAEIAILKRFPEAIRSNRTEAAQRLIEYGKTGIADFSSLDLDDEGASDFDRAVRLACRKIP